MSDPRPSPPDFARKAVAPLPTCVAVADAAPTDALNVLIHVLKDLDNAGIVARLILAGAIVQHQGTGLLELARRLGLEDRVHLVHDAGEFTLSRVYLFSQYLLSVGPDESPEITREALRYGCIPIRRTGGYGGFFDEIERIIRATFNNPAVYAATHAEVARTKVE